MASGGQAGRTVVEDPKKEEIAMKHWALPFTAQAEAPRGSGTDDPSGTMVRCVVGRVRKPSLTSSQQYFLPVGTKQNFNQ